MTDVFFARSQMGMSLAFHMLTRDMRNADNADPAFGGELQAISRTESVKIPSDSETDTASFRGHLHRT